MRAISAALLATVATALAATSLVETSPPGLRLRLDPSSTPLIASGDPAAESYRRAVDDFGDDEVFVVAMHTTEVFRAGPLETLHRLRLEIQALPGVRRVESLQNATVIRNDAKNDVLHVGPLARSLPEDDEARRILRDQALSDPLVVRTLVSEDSRTAALNVRLAGSSDLEDAESGVAPAIRELVESHAAPGRAFYFAGRPHMKAAAHATMGEDLQHLPGLAIAVMSLALAILVGSWRGVLLPMGMVLLATLWTFGIVAAVDIPINLLTVALAPILITVGGVYGVHLLAHYEAAAARGGAAEEISRELARTARTPVLLAGTTTICGFGALLLAEAPAARQLGSFGAIGVAAVTLISLGLVPALVARFPGTGQRTASTAARFGTWLDERLERLAGAVAAHPGSCVLAWGLLCIASVALATQIEVDTDYISFFPADSDVRTDFDAVNSALAGTVPIYVVLGGESGHFEAPEALRRLARIQSRAEALPTVTHATSVADMVELTQRAIHGGGPELARIPDSREDVAETLFLIPNRKRRPLLNQDHSRANLLVRTGERGSEAIRGLVRDLEAILDEELPTEIDREVTGDAVLLNRSADRLALAQLWTVGATALAIFVLVSLAYRSRSLAAVALAPNLAPIALFYGALGLGLAPLSLPTSLIGSIVLGIAVDDTAHYLAHYREGLRRGLSAEEAVVACGRRVGRPIAITSLMLVCGFLVVSASGFATLREFGGLVGLTVVFCLASDLVLLPALLLLTGARVR